jgi:hypothetical protein
MSNQMSISELVEVFGKLDATDQSAEMAIATFILANVKLFKNEMDKKIFLSDAIQAYAKLLQDAGVKVA